jgi:hypothetical protein
LLEPEPKPFEALLVPIEPTHASPELVRSRLFECGSIVLTASGVPREHFVEQNLNSDMGCCP